MSIIAIYLGGFNSMVCLCEMTTLYETTTGPSLYDAWLTRHISVVGFGPTLCCQPFRKLLVSFFNGLLIFGPINSCDICRTAIPSVVERKKARSRE